MGNHYAVFSAQYLPHIGGVENYTHYLARALSHQGSKVEIITLSAGDTYTCEQEDEHVTVHRLPGRSMLDGRLPLARRNAAFRHALHALEDLDVDRVLVNTRFYGLSLDGLSYAQQKKIPCIVLDHGSAHLTLGNPVADAVIERYEHAMTRKVQAYNPAFAGVSKKSVEWLQHFGIQTATVLPNAIDANAFVSQTSNRDFRSEYRVGDATLVAFTGRIAPEKGIQHLVEAAKLVEGDEFVFMCAGEGPLRASLQSSAPAHVHFLGPMERLDLAALLSQADVFCLPSRSEGFSTSLLEAAACGLPIVTTNVGGAAELISSDKEGVIVADTNALTLVDALRQVVQRPGRDRESRVSRADRVAKNFTWDATALLLAEAFSQLEDE